MLFFSNILFDYSKIRIIHSLITVKQLTNDYLSIINPHMKMVIYNKRICFIKRNT